MNKRYSKRKIRICSVCNQSIDESKPNEVLRHNRECDPLMRTQRLRQKILEETHKQRSVEHRNVSMINYRHIAIPVPKGTLMEGGYTSQMTKGMTSSDIEKYQEKYQNEGSVVQTSNDSFEDERDNDTDRATSIHGSNQPNNEWSSSSSQNDPTNSNSISISKTSFNQNHRSIIDHNVTAMEVSSNSLLRMANTSNSSIHRNTISMMENQYIDLLKILNSINAPKHAYNDIVKWARNLNTNLMAQPISRENLISSLSKKLSLENLFPKMVALILPCGNTVQVTKTCFLTALFSLLSDPDLMQPQNLVFGNDIFRKFKIDNDNHVFNDVESGKWYSETQYRMCKDGNDVLVPIILYIDKTYIKSKPAEPISFTLGIFKRHIRNDARAWRELGRIPGKLGDLVPNRKFPQNKLAEIKLNNWHSVCSFLLSDLKSAQNQNGLHWVMHNQKCKLQIPIMYIVGDIMGHDMICSRKSGHSKMMKGVTHSCNISRSNCGDPYAECQLYGSNDIRSLQSIVQDMNKSNDEKNQAILQLNQKGFYSDVKNAFADLDFGANPNGIHGACAICLMHTFKQKFPNVVTEIYFLIYSQSSKSKNRLLVNRSVTRLIPRLLRQSYRSFPILTSFTVSLLKPKYTLSANEKFARTFALFLFSMTTFGWTYPFKCKHRQIMNDIEIKRRISLLEETISIYYFMFSTDFKKQYIGSGQQEIRAYMDRFKNCMEYFDYCPDEVGGLEEQPVDRDDDDNDSQSSSSTEEETKPKKDHCTFPKFHYLTHVCAMIEMYGSSQNFDGGINESHHKYNTKSPGNRSQGRMHTFDSQTSNNLVSNIVIDKAIRCRNTIHVGEVSSESPNHIGTKSAKSTTNIEINNGSSKFIITPNGRMKWTKSDYTIPEKVRTFFFSNVVDTLPNKQGILGFTELNYKGNIIRAHPSYNNDEWYDWVQIQWQYQHGVYYCPSKVLLFYAIDGDLYAIVHSTKVDETTGQPMRNARKVWEQRGSSDVVKFWTMESNYRIVSVGVFNSTAFVYNDYKDEDMCEATGYKIEIKDKPSFEWKHKK